MKLSDSDVLYEDNHILAIWKPGNLLTQDDGTAKENLQDLAKEYIKAKHQKPGNVFLHAVHRLDKGVSGIVLFAKTSKALSRLNESLRNKLFEKIYIAEVEGVLSPSEGILEHTLVHDDFKARIDPKGKKCTLRYKVEKNRVIIHLETGRYHQIRAQLAAAGCPIIGDAKYGSRTDTGGILHLKHAELSFPHPITKEKITLSETSR